VFATDARFGPLAGQLLHFSYGTGSWFLVLREQVDGQSQGAAVPLPGEFRSGAHRGRFHPRDGQLYVSGMGGWGNYALDDGCFQRVRYTGEPAQVPTAFHAHKNGVLLTFSQPIDRNAAGRPDRQFVQAWNYRYSPGYGSSEWSPTHPGTAGHDRLSVRSAHVLDDGKSLFLDIPDLQPVNQLHLHLSTGKGQTHDLFATVHRLAAPFTGFPGFRPVEKTVAAHPILADMAALSVKPVPNPWLGPAVLGARLITVEAGKNLSFVPRTLKARAGEPIRLTFSNPDVVPHNWALVKAGALARFGALVNRIVADPEAALKQYVPNSDDLLAYTDVVAPGGQFTIDFRAPTAPGRYPFLCTFPGHWAAMNGELVVE
jgi:azurin